MNYQIIAALIKYFNKIHLLLNIFGSYFLCL
jgi:hypothetical protein